MITIYLLLLLIGFLPLGQASEDSLYDFLWLDPDKAVYVLQNKEFKKKFSLYVDLGYATNKASEFQTTTGQQFKIGGFLHETWGAELLYTKFTNQNNDAYENVSSNAGKLPHIRRPTSLLGFLLIWSPFYGKINTFNQIFYLDWMFGMGIGQLETQSNLRSMFPTEQPLRYDPEKFYGVIVKTNIKWYFNSKVNASIEVQDTIFKGPYNPYRLTDEKYIQNVTTVFAIGLTF